jgi:hypothetical protein
MPDDDSRLRRALAGAVGVATGSALGLLGGALAVLVIVAVALTLFSPLLYPAFRGMLCYPLDVYPDLVLSFAEFYVDVFDGVYGDLGGC